jgi:hypothetical protein
VMLLSKTARDYAEIGKLTLNWTETVAQ